jgi:hypothetical protein
VDNFKALIPNFYFGVLLPGARTLSRLLFKVFILYFMFISPLHVSALAGHLQAEFTIIVSEVTF